MLLLLGNQAHVILEQGRVLSNHLIHLVRHRDLNLRDVTLCRDLSTQGACSSVQNVLVLFKFRPHCLSKWAHTAFMR